MTSIKMVMVVSMTTFFGLLLVSQLAHAEIYKWVDEKGTVHFTDDPVTIPQEYWDKTESRKTEEDRMTMEEKVKAKQEQERRAKESIEASKQEFQVSLQNENKPKVEKQIMQMKKESDAEIKKEEKLRKEEDSYDKSLNSDGKGWIGIKLSTSNDGSVNMSKKNSIYGGKGKSKNSGQGQKIAK